MNIIKKIYVKNNLEPIALEVLRSALYTKQTQSVLKTTQELLYAKGKHKIIEILQGVEKAVIEEGQELLDALFYQEMLTPETYTQLKEIAESTKLEAEHVTEYIEKETYEKKLKGKLKKVLLSKYPIIIIGLIAMIVLPIMFKTFVYDYLKETSMYWFYKGIVEHPMTLGGLYVIGAFVGILLGLKILMELLFSSKKAYFSFISLIKILKQAGMSYEKIFKGLMEKNIPTKLRIVTSIVYEKLQTSTPSEALTEIVKDKEIGIATIFINRINTGDDIYAWKLLETEEKEKLEETITKMESILMVMAILIAFVFVGIGMFPLGYGIIEILSKTSM